MNRKIVISPNEYYHLYNRGVEKRDIYADIHDYERFLKALYVCNGANPVSFRTVRNKPLPEIERGSPTTAIGAYALMPNHFHILVREIREGGISLFMEKLITSYAKYFNTRYERVGPLFQSRFKAEHVDRDEYLKYLFAYIHLNPVKLIEPKWKERGIHNKTKARRYLQNYRYSSYSDYTGVEREEKLILNREVFPSYFLSKQEFEDFVGDWLWLKLQ